MPRRFLVALTLVVTAVLAACGSTPAGSSSAPTVQPPTSGASTNPGTGTRDWCLNTTAEVSAAIGGAAVRAASSEAPGVGGGCFYTTADGKLVYSVATITSGAAVSTFEAAKSTQGVIQVPGIGDDAILMSPQGPLAVRKGNAFISLGTLPDSGITEADWRTKNEELARAAVGRL